MRQTYAESEAPERKRRKKSRADKEPRRKKSNAEALVPVVD